MSKRLSTDHLNNHNVAYWNFQPFWNDVLRLMEPLPGELALFLDRFAKENRDEFGDRCKRLSQINMVRIVEEIFISMCFSTDFQVKAVKFQDDIDAFNNNCTMQGDDIATFMREEVAPVSFTYGFSDIVLDLPKSDQNNLSVDQANALGLTQPYAYVIPPLNRYNWKIDSSGAFLEYHSTDFVNTQVTGNLGLTGTAASQKQYTSWTLDSVTTYDDDGKPTKAFPNPYGFIPIVTCIPITKSMRYGNERMGISLVQDIVPLQKRILNVMSLIYDFHENVNFPERIWKQDTSSGDEPPTEGELSEGGNKRGKVMRGKDSDYFLVEPDAAGVQSMCDYLQSLIEWCRESVHLSSDSGSNKTHQSRHTIRANSSTLFNKLTMYTKHFAKTVKQINEMALRVQGKSEQDIREANITVQWDTNFSFESFVSSLEQLAILKQTVADMSPKLIAEFTKKTATPQMWGTGQTDGINSEIDGWAVRQQAANVNPQPLDPQTGKPQTFQQQNTQLSAAAKVEDEENPEG